MSPRLQRTLLWIVLIAASLVLIGVFVQVYLIAVYILGGNADALDTHTDLGGAVHGVEVLVLLAALGAYWKRWRFLAAAAALAVVGTLQLGLVDAGGEWVQGLHGLLALVVLILAHEVAQRAVRELGLGR
jgi:hypothetical protein